MTKDKHAYNVTITHDPTSTTTNEQRAMLIFSIELMNETYEASVREHSEKQGDHVQ